MMDRRQFLKNSMLGAGSLALPGLTGPLVRGHGSQKQPNILLLFADDMTYHDLGNPQVNTPNLNRLASQGIRFGRAFNSAPMCAPTRMSLYTGIHPVRNGAWPNHSRIYPDIRTWPQYLQTLGYRTALIGKQHEAPKEQFPFEILDGRHHDNGKGIDMELSKVRAFMEANKSDPWSLIVASNQPHGPWNRGNTYPYKPEEIDLPPYLVDTPETRQAVAKYYAEITYMDEQMGTVLQYLKETGQEEHTIVVFLSEQGAHLPHCKWTCYDTGVRSTAIVRWPGVTEPGRSSDAIIQYVDVLPTLLDAIGGSPPKHDFDGQSFLPVLTGQRNTHNDYAFSEQTSKGIYNGPEAYGIRSVRSDNYRLIWNLNHKNEFQNLVTGDYGPFESWRQKAKAGDPFAAKRVKWYQKRPELELYNNQKDPFELHNVAEDPAYREVRNNLKSQLDQWMSRQGDKGAETERQALERQSERWKE